MPSSQLLAFIGNRGVGAVDFSGTNQFMATGTGLTGASDAKTGIFSCWVRLDGSDATAMRILNGVTAVGGSTFRLNVSRDGDDHFEIEARNAAGTGILLIDTAGTYTAGATWYNFLSSWDLSTGVTHLYINDLSDVVETTATDDSIDYTVADWGIAASPASTGDFHGCLAEIYFAPAQYIDLSVESNRRKFISATGKPVSLGSDGSTPTGSAPLVYQSVVYGQAVSGFATNKGTAEDFVITGSPTVCSASPSD